MYDSKETIVNVGADPMVNSESKFIVSNSSFGTGAVVGRSVGNRKNVVNTAAHANPREACVLLLLHATKNTTSHAHNAATTQPRPPRGNKWQHFLATAASNKVYLTLCMHKHTEMHPLHINRATLPSLPGSVGGSWVGSGSSAEPKSASPLPLLSGSRKLSPEPLPL